MVNVNFKDIKNTICRIMLEKQGLFLGTGHKDEHFNKYLAEAIPELSELVVMVIFAEIDQEAFSTYCIPFEKMKHQISTDFVSIHSYLKVLIQDSNASIEFLALLITLHLSKITIVPYNDLLAKSGDDSQVHDVLYGKSTNLSLKDLHWASLRRVSEDAEIAKIIKQLLLSRYQDKKYIIIGGPAHVGIASALDIDVLNVMSAILYQNLLLGSDPSIIRNLQAAHVKSFSFEEHSLKCKSVDWFGQFQTAVPMLPASITQLSEKGNDFLNNAGLFSNNSSKKNQPTAHEWEPLSRTALEQFKAAQYKNACMNFQKARASLEQIHGKNHQHTATVIYNIGSCLFHMKQFEEAKILFTECKEIRETLFGSDSEETRKVLAKLQSVDQKLKNLNNSHKI